MSDTSSKPLIAITDTRIETNFNTVAEAKQAIKELKIKKKEFGLQKKTVANEMKLIRAQYTNEVRTRGRMPTGKGFIASIAKIAESSSRDSRKVKLANDLHPLEVRQHNVEKILVAIDSLIIQIETYIMKEQSSG